MRSSRFFAGQIGEGFEHGEGILAMVLRAPIPLERFQVVVLVELKVRDDGAHARQGLHPPARFAVAGGVAEDGPEITE